MRSKGNCELQINSKRLFGFFSRYPASLPLCIPASAVIALLLLLTGCLMGPNYKKPVEDLPAAADNQNEIAPFIKHNWWEMFQDPVLNSLVQETLAGNKDIQIALARVEEAQAQFKITRADSMPSLNMGFQGTYGTASNDGVIIEQPVQLYTTAPVISYELDIWGKQRRLNQSAKARYFSTKAAKDLTELIVTANVVNAYFLLLTLDAQLEIVKDTLESYGQIVKVYRDRYKAGYIEELDLRRVEADMQSVEVSKIDLERQISQAQSALAVLAGKTPREIVEQQMQRGKKLEEVYLIPNIPEGIPSKVLEKRADVLQAEEQLISANAQIGAARASYFPQISLTGEAGYVSNSLTNLMDAGIWSLAGNLVQPLFEGGKIKAMNKQAEAAYKEALAVYEQTVENAFKDVYDSLNANKMYREIYVAADLQAKAMNRSYKIAADQFKAGLIDTINLLDVKNSYLQAQTALVSARYNQLTAVVNLSKALGGGWNEKDVK